MKIKLFTKVRIISNPLLIWTVVAFLDDEFVSLLNEKQGRYRIAHISNLQAVKK